MSFKAIAVAYGMIGAVAVAGVATDHFLAPGAGSGGAAAPQRPSSASAASAALPPPSPWQDRQWYAAVIPYDSRIHMPLGPEDGKPPVITWYRTREEVAQAVEAAARATGNPEIVRLAQEKRELADLEAGLRSRQLASLAPPEEAPAAAAPPPPPSEQPIAAKPLDPPVAIAVAGRDDPTPLDAEEERMLTAAAGKPPKPAGRRREPHPSEFQLHLGSYADAEAAKSAWEALRRTPAFSGLSGEVVRVPAPLPGGALYRVVAGAWTDADDATRKCLALRADGGRCEAVVYKEERAARRVARAAAPSRRAAE
jgi:hypothetical protein